MRRNRLQVFTCDTNRLDSVSHLSFPEIKGSTPYLIV